MSGVCGSVTRGVRPGPLGTAEPRGLYELCLQGGEHCAGQARPGGAERAPHWSPPMRAITVGYRDTLERLNENVPLSQKVRAVHWVIQERLGDVDRVAAAVHDPATDLLKTFLFAPLHDVGKIGLPDSVLHKEGKLTPEEFELVKTHPLRGREIVDTLIADFGLVGLEDVEALRNIAAYHHEALNGSGYPLGLSDGKIPLEARIIAVADVFDALTSRRPYKRAWSNDEAFALLRELAGVKLDAECVEALVSRRAEVEEIQRQFREDPYG